MASRAQVTKTTKIYCKSVVEVLKEMKVRHILNGDNGTFLWSSENMALNNNALLNNVNIDKRH